LHRNHRIRWGLHLILEAVDTVRERLLEAVDTDEVEAEVKRLLLLTTLQKPRKPKRNDAE